MEKCPDSKPYIDLDIYCKNSCPFDRKYVEENSHCVSECDKEIHPLIEKDIFCVSNCSDSNPFNDLGFCRNQCPEERKFIEEENTCVSQCDLSKHPKVEEEKCVEKCSERNPFSDNNICLKECPEERHFIYDGTCIDDCKKTEKKEVEDNICVSKDSGGLSTNTIIGISAGSVFGISLLEESGFFGCHSKIEPSYYVCPCNAY